MKKTRRNNNLRHQKPPDERDLGQCAGSRAAPDRRAGPGGARLRDRRAGARRPGLPAGARASLGQRRLHRADHGRAAGRHDVDRGLRDRVARAVAGARRRRSDRPRLSAGDCPRPASTVRWCGAPISSAMPDNVVKIEMEVPPMAASASAACCSASRAIARGSGATTPSRRIRQTFCCRSRTWRKRKLVLTDALIAEALRRSKQAERELADGADSPEHRTTISRPRWARSRRATPAVTTISGAHPQTRAAAPSTKETDRWPSAPTGSNCCRSPTRSPAKSRSTAAS